MTETDLQRSIKKALERNGFWVLRMGVNMKRGKRGTQSGEPGTPDLLMLGRARGWLEIKVPGGELSDEQRSWHERAIAQGERVATVTSVEDAIRTAIRWRDRGDK